MFSNLGLLKSGKCPEGESCTRIRCFLNHGPTDNATPTKTASTKTEKKRPVDPSLTSPLKTSDLVKRERVGDTASSGRSPVKVAKVGSKVGLRDHEMKYGRLMS